MLNSWRLKIYRNCIWLLVGWFFDRFPAWLQKWVFFAPASSKYKITIMMPARAFWFSFGTLQQKWPNFALFHLFVLSVSHWLILSSSQNHYRALAVSWCFLLAKVLYIIKLHLLAFNIKFSKKITPLIAADSKGKSARKRIWSRQSFWKQFGNSWIFKIKLRAVNLEYNLLWLRAQGYLQGKARLFSQFISRLGTL